MTRRKRQSYFAGKWPAPQRGPRRARGAHESRSHAFPVPQCRALSRSPVHADLRDRRRAGAEPRVEPELRRPAQIRDARLLRVRPVLVSGRMARRQMEPRGHDGRVLHRHRDRGGRDRLCRDAAAGRHRAVRDRRVRRDLPSGRSRDGDAEMEEHRHAARGERRVGKSRRRERRADHRLPDRQWRLAHGVHHSGLLLGSRRPRLCAGAPAGHRGGAIATGPRPAASRRRWIAPACSCACR